MTIYFNSEISEISNLWRCVAYQNNEKVYDTGFFAKTKEKAEKFCRKEVDKLIQNDALHSIKNSRWCF